MQGSLRRRKLHLCKVRGVLCTPKSLCASTHNWCITLPRAKLAWIPSNRTGWKDSYGKHGQGKQGICVFDGLGPLWVGGLSLSTCICWDALCNIVVGMHARFKGMLLYLACKLGCDAADPWQRHKYEPYCYAFHMWPNIWDIAVIMACLPCVCWGQTSTSVWAWSSDWRHWLVWRDAAKM